MRRTSALLVAALLCGVWGLDAGTATADACEKKLNDTSTALTCEGKLGWTYDPATRTFVHGSVFASATADDPYEYTERIACDENTPGSATNHSCARASNCPPRLDPDGQPMLGIRIEAFRRLKANPHDPWQPTDDGVCKYTGRTVPMANVVAAARQTLEKQVGRPSIIAQPPGGVTLVNFVSLFHAPVQNVTRLRITAPVRGEITATPYYTWDLGDGITAEGAGHAYDQRFDPRKHESDDYYVKAFYRTRGIKHVTLTLTWNVTITLDDSGAIPLEPIVFTADTTTTAKTAAARLVAR
jgi:hypothetical protein